MIVLFFISLACAMFGFITDQIAFTAASFYLLALIVALEINDYVEHIKNKSK